MLGYPDDLILIPLGVAIALRMIPPAVMQDARLRIADMERKPAKWIAAAVIVAVWIVLAGLGIILVLRLFQN